jgi:hypothetical protein
MLFSFFEHHGFLQRRQLPWLTVEGGSRTYVDTVARRLEGRVRLLAPVRRVARGPDGVVLEAGGGGPERFDAVVLACHADEALASLADPSPEETALLSRFRYARHRVWLHQDPSFLPRSRGAWAAWNCDMADCRDAKAPVFVTYWLNRLQSLPVETTWCVTLNADREPRGTVARLEYAHPLLTADAVAAQAPLAALGGRRATWFAGAHLRHGFHEDGFASAQRVAAALGASP